MGLLNASPLDLSSLTMRVAKSHADSKATGIAFFLSLSLYLQIVWVYKRGVWMLCVFLLSKTLKAGVGISFNKTKKKQAIIKCNTLSFYVFH